MDQDNHSSQQNNTPLNKDPMLEPYPNPKEPTPLRTRIFAGLGALFVIILVLLYTYSLATGKIFAW